MLLLLVLDLLTALALVAIQKQRLCYSGEQVFVTVPSCIGCRDQKCVEAFTKIVLSEDHTESSENTQDGDKRYSTKKYCKGIVTNFLIGGYLGALSLQWLLATQQL